MYEEDEELLEEETETVPERTEKERNDDNNARNVRNAADVAIASKNPYAMAAGKAVKVADKISGGKSSEAIGKGISNVNKHAPMGRKVQRASNKLAESGASDAIGSGAAMKNGSGNSNATTTSSNIDNSRDKKGTIVKALKNPIARKVILLSIPIILFLLIIAMIVAAISDDSSGGLATGGYYHIPCDEVTVIFTDKNNNYEPTGTETYPLEEYVAGVVVGEVAYLGSHELDKAFAIAARTFFAAYAENNGCTIESSDRYQVFRTEKSASATKAAEETKNQVLLMNNKLYGIIQYDAFACIAEDENYYTISQANQKVPKAWIDNKINRDSKPEWFICNGKENLQNHHGNGMSQFGGLYLATEQDYKYDQILQFYLGDEVTISSGYITSIAGLDIKTTTGAKNYLNTPINDFLSSNGSSLDQYNDFIQTNVQNIGFGTRAGVVTAAVSLVNFLYDNFNAKLPYYWGGQAQQYGLPATIGTNQTSAISPGGHVYYYRSFDCSGFVSWAIKNGGYKISRLTTHGFDSSFSSDSCDIGDTNCIGQPGDLINSASCHVQMIVSVDEANGKYYVVESTGEGVIMRQWGMHQGNCSSGPTKILHMDNYYNNQNNIDN